MEMISEEMYFSATKSGDGETLECLLEEVNPLFFRDNVFNMLSCAFENNYLNIVEILVETCDRLQVSYEDFIGLGAKMGNLEIVKYFFQEGACGECALEWAVAEGHTNIVKYLVANGVELITTPGIFPLAEAIKKGYIETILFLLEERALPVDTCNEIFKLAAGIGNIKVVNFLLENRPDLTGRLDVNSALLLATAHGHLEVGDYLHTRVTSDSTKNKHSVNNIDSSPPSNSERKEYYFDLSDEAIGQALTNHYMLIKKWCDFGTSNAYVEEIFEDKKMEMFKSLLLLNCNIPGRFLPSLTSSFLRSRKRREVEKIPFSRRILIKFRQEMFFPFAILSMRLYYRPGSLGFYRATDPSI